MSDPLIFEMDDALSATSCRAMIRQFEKDPHKGPGITMGGLNVAVKDSTDLCLSSHESWKTFDEILCKSIGVIWIRFLEHLKRCDMRIDLHSGFRDNGYNIKKYEKGRGHYDWHQDSHIYPNANNHRAFTILWYLNTVKEGGETCFRNRTISPVQGKALIFPSTFTYMHKGCMPVSGPKYIIATFLLWPNT